MKRLLHLYPFFWSIKDLEADFRVFYRLTPAEMRELPSSELAYLAERTIAYQGVIRMRAEAEARKNETPPPSDMDKVGRRVVEADAASVNADPILSQLIDIS